MHKNRKQMNEKNDCKLLEPGDVTPDNRDKNFRCVFLRPRENWNEVVVSCGLMLFVGRVLGFR